MEKVFLSALLQNIYAINDTESYNPAGLGRTTYHRKNEEGPRHIIKLIKKFFYYKLLSVLNVEADLHFGTNGESNFEFRL